MALKQINPNSDKDFIDAIDINNENNFPQFLKSITLSPFRHIDDLTINFPHPISIISGTNRSGKSTILMALACSHFEFKKRNVHNGKFERQTWSSLMQFTDHDKQTRDWTYFITYKWGKKIETKRGQRKAKTKKWNGIGKKESQFFNRQVFFIDLDRILPARNFARTIFHRAKKSTSREISPINATRIENYLSYVLEEKFTLNRLADHLDKDIFKYNTANEYSSYNAATGEEVLIKIIIDSVEAPQHSLILIDEIEVGLHPKIQRRLISALYNISRNERKQFIITSHSPSILSSVPDNARIFIEKMPTGAFKAIPNISVNACLSKMDSISYPLVDLYCEDSEAEKIIQKAISSIQIDMKVSNFSDLINVIVSGAGDITYSFFKAHQKTYPSKRIKTGYACVLDGDRKKVKTNGSISYPPEECLHFIYSDESPEKFLTRSFLAKHPNSTVEYHLNHSNGHSLFGKLIENSFCTSKEEAFEICWKEFISTTPGNKYFEELKAFIVGMAKKYSPDL
ncbi:AAA family ATPase [Flavobacterium sp. CYK-55]|uniref:AAA family ATPase n=1 Tax=Flavobacterium sp. CYK-55 TaxID=2835529 RepID=UPI001BCB9622|nr:AAA family ATPase [Flavobacterium sp. CYK-55]MBS7788322.1 AAA family ATPase [Flavobacterium sp. CYK-55]